MKTYRHPETMAIKTVDGKDDVREAALVKLGYVVITAETIESEPPLSVTYEQVNKATPATEPPALPKLATPVPPAPTRDTSQPVTNKTGAGITREDVQPLSDKGK